MSIFEILGQIGTVEVHTYHDQETGLRAAVGIHDTRLGPAIGGTRMFAYSSGDEAVLDVVRLARGMTYKAALAGLPHGGGKAVIWTDPARPITDRRAFMQSFGRFVDRLGGRYITCEDSGTSTADMDLVRDVTSHVLGVSVARGGSGDPSPFTALGVRRGIEACAEIVLGKKDLVGMHVAIQGVGAVGDHLARELASEGCRLTIADVNQPRVKEIAHELGAAMVPVEQIFDVPCDVFAPCALGGAINDATINRLRCKIVAGAANNQLASREIGQVLQARGIFYAPDYAINAGGLINVAHEYRGYDAEASRQKTLGIKETIAELARRSLRTSTPPGEMADAMVAEILAKAGPSPFQPSPTNGSNAAIFASPASSVSRGTAV
jgi:leucine dehydrogenase